MGELDVREVEGDLLEQPSQALVNPWNRNFVPRLLLVPCGVSGQLKKRTGPEPWRELARMGTLEEGAAVVTGPGRMVGPEYLIHVAGLSRWWKASPAGVAEGAHNALLRAWELGIRSVAMPLIGAGTGGLNPADARVAILVGAERAVAAGVCDLEVVIVSRPARA